MRSLTQVRHSAISLAFTGRVRVKAKLARLEKFLTCMVALLPWTKLPTVIEPFHHKAERGRPPVGLEGMLRIYFLQQWCGLADEAREYAFYDKSGRRGFIRIDPVVEGAPDRITLLRFFRQPESRGLYRGFLSGINVDGCGSLGQRVIS